MDAAEIAEMVRELKLSKETDGEGVLITKEDERKGKERLARTVVGKIFARRMVNKEIIKTHLPRILRARGGMEIEIIGHNIFAITCALASDKRVALEDGPWHFFQDLMIIKETDPMQSVADVEFNEIAMWIQCHNVPMACMERDILERIGGKVGKVEEIDMDEGGIRLGKTVRIRIKRSLNIPLIRCVPVKKENSDDDTFVIIQYEKLPHFCFACGRIGHIVKDCEVDGVDRKVLRYDHRMRAGNTANTQGYKTWGGGSSSGWVPPKEKNGPRRNDERGVVLRETVVRKSVGDESGSEEVVGEIEGVEEEEEEENVSGKEERERVGLESASRDEAEEGDNDGRGLDGGVLSFRGKAVVMMEDSLVLSAPGEDSLSNRKKQGGGRWKKRAREDGPRKVSEGMGESEMLVGGCGNSKRRLEMDENDQTPSKRLDRKGSALANFDDSTAAVAQQPRRAQ